MASRGSVPKSVSTTSLGCLRTPSGGSSRQTIMIVEDEQVRSRLLSPREAARLMGLPDSYELPENYNEAYHLAGDGVVVPVVRQHRGEHSRTGTRRIGVATGSCLIAVPTRLDRALKEVLVRTRL